MITIQNNTCLLLSLTTCLWWQWSHNISKKDKLGYRWAFIYLVNSNQAPMLTYLLTYLCSGNTKIKNEFSACHKNWYSDGEKRSHRRSILCVYGMMDVWWVCRGGRFSQPGSESLTLNWGQRPPREGTHKGDLSRKNMPSSRVLAVHSLWPET